MDSTTAYVLAVILVATVIRSAFGFGEALVAVPLLALRIPVTVAAPLAVLVSVTVAAVVVVQDWRKIELRSAMRLVAAASVGIPFGLLLLTRLNSNTVKVILGAVIAGYSIYSLKPSKAAQLKDENWTWTVAAGFCSGVMGGAYGMNGPPLAVYGSLRGWSPPQFRATLQAYFLPASLLGLAGYAAVGLWSAQVTRSYMLSLPFVLIAIVIGRALNHRMRGDGFFRIIYGGLIVTSATLIAQTLLK